MKSTRDHISHRECRRCGQCLLWRRVCFRRPKDQAIDWDLVVWCPDCAAPPTQDDRTAIRAEHDQLVGQDLSRMQADRLRHRLGQGMYCLLEQTTAGGTVS